MMLSTMNDSSWLSQPSISQRALRQRFQAVRTSVPPDVGADSGIRSVGCGRVSPRPLNVEVTGKKKTTGYRTSGFGQSVRRVAGHMTSPQCDKGKPRRRVGSPILALGGHMI